MPFKFLFEIFYRDSSCLFTKEFELREISKRESYADKFYSAFKSLKVKLECESIEERKHFTVNQRKKNFQWPTFSIAYTVFHMKIKANVIYSTVNSIEKSLLFFPLDWEYSIRVVSEVAGRETKVIWCICEHLHFLS